jgi:hypothetical protein
MGSKGIERKKNEKLGRKSTAIGDFFLLLKINR